MYKILYLPTGRFVSDSIWHRPVPDLIFESIEKAEYSIQCKCNLDFRVAHCHEVKEASNCWSCYNEFSFPIIKEHFAIVEVV